MITFLSKSFWVIALIITVSNAYSLKSRAERLNNQNPEFKEGYTKLFWSYIIEFGTPWIVMGFGIIIGGVPTIFHFLRPQDGNMYVLAFYLAMIIILLSKIVWVYFAGGAKFLAAYSGPLQRPSLLKSPLSFKITSILSLIAAIGIMAIIWFMDVPTPKS